MSVLNERKTFPMQSAKYSSNGERGGSSKYRSGYQGDKRRGSPGVGLHSSPDAMQSPRYHKSSSAGSQYKRDSSYRDRDYNSVYRDSRDGSPPAKERRRDNRDRGSDHRSSMSKKDSSPRVGDWSEHKSSSGKKYYYNCRSEVSQWDKPVEWLQYEQRQNSSSKQSSSYSGYQHSSGSSNVNKGGGSAYNSSSSSNSKSNSSYNSSSTHPSLKCNTNSYSSNSNYSSSCKSSSYGSNGPPPTNNKTSVTNSHHAPCPKDTNHDRQKIDKHSIADGHSFRIDEHHYDKMNRKYSAPGLDMTPPDMSSSSLDHLHSRSDARTKHNSIQNSNCSLTPSNSNVALSTNHSLTNSINTINTSSTVSSCSNSQSSNNPNYSMSNIGGRRPSADTPDKRHQNMEEFRHANENSRHPMSGNENMNNSRHPSGNTGNDGNMNAFRGNHMNDSRARHCSISDTRHPNDLRQQAAISDPRHTADPRHAGIPDTRHSIISESSQDGEVLRSGTPTRSEQPDLVERKGDGSTASNGRDSAVSSGSGLSSLASLSAAPSWGAPRPSLSPGFSRFYNEALVGHVREWPAEALERQSARLAEEAHAMGSLSMTRVSADLKMARSMVRLSEIQATLNEQRILFLRAQKRELEETKTGSIFSGDPAGS